MSIRSLQSIVTGDVAPIASRALQSSLARARDAFYAPRPARNAEDARESGRRITACISGRFARRPWAVVSRASGARPASLVTSSVVPVTLCTIPETRASTNDPLVVD